MPNWYEAMKIADAVFLILFDVLLAGDYLMNDSITDLMRAF
jgi:hypothetical protein